MWPAYPEARPAILLPAILLPAILLPAILLPAILLVVPGGQSLAIASGHHPLGMPGASTAGPHGGNRAVGLGWWANWPRPTNGC